MSDKKLNEVEFLKLENLQLKAALYEKELNTVYKSREMFFKEMQDKYGEEDKVVVLNPSDGTITLQNK